MANAFNEIPVSYLKEALIYDEETGKLFWSQNRPVSHFKKPCRHKHYMTAVAGKEAGTVRRFHLSDYSVLHIGKRQYLAHRVIWAMVHGEWPNSILDHVNGNGLDNRLCNIRLSDHTENARNHRLTKKNTSGFGGVKFDKRTAKWNANAKLNYIDHDLGSFAKKEDAIAAREAFNKQHGFSDRHGKPHDAALSALAARKADDNAAKAELCVSCGGSGTVDAMTHGYGPDDYAFPLDCPDCSGTGGAK